MNTATTTIIHVDGTTETESWPANKSPGLDWLQAAVGGGYVEALPCGDDVAFCNDNPHGLELNKAATAMLVPFTGGQGVRGPVVVLQGFRPGVL